jgi:hypothetical protein
MPKTPKTSQTVESQAEFLVSSNTLPEFDDLNKEWEEILAEEEQQKAKKAKKSGLRQVAKSDKPDSEKETLAQEITATDIEDWVCLPLDIMFSRQEKAKLSRIERLAWSKSCAEMLNKYLPNIAAKFGAEIGFGICLATILAVRYKPNVSEPDDSSIRASRIGQNDVAASQLRPV